MGNHFFMAIPLENSIREELSTQQEIIKKQLTYKQWPFPEDFHITLKFYGDLPDNKVRQLIDTFQVIKNISRFHINIGGLGYFGNPSRPRVLWGGVERNDSLQKLYSTIEELSRDCGIAMENRPYRPHITIAKNWIGEQKKDQVNKFSNMYTNKQKMSVENVVLYQIFPQKRPKYHQVASYELKGDGDTGSAN